jgi:hypothetical protein
MDGMDIDSFKKSICSVCTQYHVLQVSHSIPSSSSELHPPHIRPPRLPTTTATRVALRPLTPRPCPRHTCRGPRVQRSAVVRACPRPRPRPARPTMCTAWLLWLSTITASRCSSSCSSTNSTSSSTSSMPSLQAWYVLVLTFLISPAS